MALSEKQKKYLRGLAHNLHPYVTIGDRGLIPTVAEELESALAHHELVKVKLNVDREARPGLIEEIATSTGSEQVMAIGRIACYYRRNPDKPRLKVPS